ncbi:MAG: EamA family transporter [Gaiellaceae bacterium]
MADAPVAPPTREYGPDSPRPLPGLALVWSAVALRSLNATLSKIVLDSAGLSALRLAEVRATGSAVLLVAAFGILGLAFVQFFYFVAIARLPIGIALVIQYVAPVFVALWARFVVREPVRRRLWIAIALSLAGLTLVVELWSGFTLDGVGVAACVAAALAYAAYMLMAERSLRGGRDAASLVAWGFVFAALF